VEFFELAATVFAEKCWRSGYGGAAWAKIALAVARFLDGSLPPSVFVDHVFDLRHNGGKLFDKHRMFNRRTDEGYVLEQLNRKKQVSGLRELYRRLTCSRYEYSPEVSKMWQRGTQAGLW
jgi:hypothetical protein